MKFTTYEDLAKCIAQMTPEQRQKPVAVFDGHSGCLSDPGLELILATDLCEPAPENQFVIYGVD